MTSTEKHMKDENIRLNLKEQLFLISCSIIKEDDSKALVWDHHVRKKVNQRAKSSLCHLTFQKLFLLYQN